MHKNPIIDAVYAAIKKNPQGISEYQIMVELQEQNVIFPIADVDPSVSLFRKHFTVMNALYQLQQQLFEQSEYLSISPLTIRLMALNEVATTNLPTDDIDAPLREYYLDWNNFEHTSKKDVEDLLKGFWQRYLARDKRMHALQTLGLSGDATWEQVKRAYRKLAAQHHPDKGGESDDFREIREAYEILQRCYQ